MNIIPLLNNFLSGALKTPSRPVSNELKRLMVEQGAGHLLRFPTEFPPDGAAA